MSYLQFHALFILPPLVLLAWLARRRITRAHVAVLTGVAALALAFTLPWDHFAVQRKIWEFDSARVLARVWLLPIEEILFFLLETLLVGLLTILFLPVTEAGARQKGKQTPSFSHPCQGGDGGGATDEHR